MRVVPIPALSDSYIYMLIDEFDPQTAAVVDPGEAEPVLDWLRNNGRELSAILNTHHHRDHTGANARLLRYFPGIPVSAGAADKGRIPGQTLFLRNGDEIPVADRSAVIVDIPGHTKAHIAYWFPDADGGDLFSGDTIFGGSIGHISECRPETMWHSLQKIRTLPSPARIWCGHEYTLQCLRESAAADPDNQNLARRLRQIQTAIDSAPTVPLRLEEELSTNPFLRWDSPQLCRRLATLPGFDTFRCLCAMS